MIFINPSRARDDGTRPGFVGSVQLLRRWSDEQDNKFSPEVRVRAVVLDHEQEASVTVVGDRLNSGQNTYDPPRGEPSPCC
jgi:hypothetical protein